MSTTQTYTGTLVVQTCIKCGMTFGVDQNYDRARRDDHNSFYCPAGHSQFYSGKSEAEKLKDELINHERSLTYLRNANQSLHSQLTDANHKVRAEKAAKTRLKNRVKNGVCPCCNRSFQNLHNHMKNEHPDFVKS